MPPLRLGVVGLNNQGRDHIEGAAGHPEVRLAAICDSAAHQLANLRSDLDVADDVAGFQDMEALFASGMIDAAAICLPHRLHERAIDLAATHGIHLLKEKPLGRTLREAHEFTARMRRAGLVLHTGVQRRHHPSYCALRRELDARGGPRAVRSARLVMTVVPKERVPGGPRVVTWRGSYEQAGGGVLIDLGYHGVDLVQYLLGPLELVSCLLWSDKGPQAARTVEEDASVWALAGSCWTHLRFGRATKKEERIELDLGDGVLAANREGVWWTGEDGAVQLFASERTWRDAMVGQLTSLSRAIHDGDLAPNDLDTQVPALRFLEACYASFESEGLLGDER